MKRTFTRSLALVLVLCFLLSTVAFASVDSSAYIAIMSAYITFSGNDVEVNFSVVGRHIMD